VSGTHIETIPSLEPVGQVRVRRRTLSVWLQRIFLSLVALWLVGFAITLAIEHTSLAHALTARLESAFGRPVTVRNYRFSFWGPVVEARSVTVGEDPRFGQEYFLRADSMTLRLRWQSLLRGRIELGTLSLDHPSLNLVRNSANDWNLAEWLPRPSDTLSTAPGALRLSRIAVDSGRVNFKRGDDKLAVAFVNVNGTVETDNPGRWRIDLDATPWRAAVVLQQAGTMHVSGYIGGTSSRLRPAALDVAWTDASLSDVLRLIASDDSGVRGSFALSLTARAPGVQESWDIQARATLQQIHRWDLVFRPDNPSLNLAVQMNWNPASPFLEVSSIVLESPHSNAHASGRILWNRDQPSKAVGSSAVQFELSSSQIDLGDALGWLRAFHAGVADGLSVRGLVTARGTLSGWSPDLANVSVSSAGVDFLGPQVLKPVHVGPFEFRYAGGAISSTPLTLALGARTRSPDGSFRIELPPRASPKALPAWHVSGNAAEMRDLIAAAGAFGWNVSRGWDLSGPLACDLRWPSTWRPWKEQPAGWLNFGAPGDGHGASLTAPFLNQPVGQIRARVDLKPGDARHVELSSAAAFGARWIGVFDRRSPSAEWQFSLSSDGIDAADLDRWLNPVWRENFLGRMLPFLVSHPAANAVPENLRATGHLTLAEFNLGSLAVSSLKGTLAIEGRRVTFANASGQFFGGAVSGSLEADLQPVPSYRTTLDFSDVDLAALAAASAQIPDLFAGSISGHVSVRASGASRSELLASLECTGAASVENGKLKDMNLLDSLRASTRVPGATLLENTSANFSCHRRQIEIRGLRLLHANVAMEASGSIDFSRNLDLRLRVLPQVAVGADTAPERDAAWYRLTGTLAAPQISPVSTPHSLDAR
jgi:AsmA-like C-terminal region/AsmA family